MARLLRVDHRSLWYHLTARGNGQRLTFRDDRDREHFLEWLAQWVDRFRLRLHGYVLMPNHYHLLAETTEPNLSQANQWLNVSYTVWFSRRHQRVGHLFQGRFQVSHRRTGDVGLGLKSLYPLEPGAGAPPRTGQSGPATTTAGNERETFSAMAAAGPSTAKAIDGASAGAVSVAARRFRRRLEADRRLRALAEEAESYLSNIQS